MSPEKSYSLKLAVIYILFVIISFGAVTLGFAQSSEDAYRVETFEVSGNVELKVQTSGGSIKLEGTNEPEVRIEMYVRRRGKIIPAGEADLDRYKIDISQSGNKVKAIVDRDSNNWFRDDNLSISFVVHSPVQTTSSLKTSGGSLSIQNVMGEQELRTSGGSISATSVDGSLDLRTSGGSIRIEDVVGNVNARTSGGTISAASIKGALDLNTSGGSISMDKVDGSVDARTSGGSINAHINNPSDYINLKTSGGSIRINVPDGGYDLDLDANKVHIELVNFSGRAERDEIEGTINGGGVKISARTSGGSIRFNFL